MHMLRRSLEHKKKPKKIKNDTLLLRDDAVTYFPSGLLSYLTCVVWKKRKAPKLTSKPKPRPGAGMCAQWCGCLCDAKQYFDTVAIMELNKMNMQTAINSLVGFKKS